MDLLWMFPNRRRSGAPSITPERLQTEIGGGYPSVIVDVRSSEEYAAAHLPGALNIPMERLGEGLQQLDPAQSTVFY